MSGVNECRFNRSEVSRDDLVYVVWCGNSQVIYADINVNVQRSGIGMSHEERNIPSNANPQPLSTPSASTSAPTSTQANIMLVP